MKKIISLFTLSSFVATSIFAFDYQIKEGWQQLGAVEDINDLSIFDNTCVESVMRYDNTRKNKAVKKIYIPGDKKSILRKLRLKKLKKSEGFEVIATSNCTISTLSTVDPEVPTNDDEITFNGFEYKKIVSPYTGKIWLDRNLGAENVCTSFNDVTCFGDYYQWGRLTDGHEKSTSTVTSSTATDITNVGSSFILGTDWTSVDPSGEKRQRQWKLTDENSICPTGFKIPTIDELTAEFTISQNFENNFLKVPLGGFHNLRSGDLTYVNSNGYLWSTSFSSIGTASEAKVFTSSSVYSGPHYWAHGFPVRCIEN